MGSLVCGTLRGQQSGSNLPHSKKGFLETVIYFGFDGIDWAAMPFGGGDIAGEV